jgi:hypothetical protein
VAYENEFVHGKGHKAVEGPGRAPGGFQFAILK